MEKVLWVKFGWSDYYRGGPVDGNFGWLKAAKGGKSEGKGHEAFNFMPIDGTYYCYVPPQAKKYAPSHHENTGWTVICLAKNPKHKGIHVVGWYENATLLGGWYKPPNPGDAKKSGTVGSAYDWSYCIESETAYFVPPEHRTMPFSDPSIRQGKYSFLAGPDIRQSPEKFRVLDLLKERVAALNEVAIHNPSEQTAPDPELDQGDPLLGFGTPEHRKMVEKAAERAVISFYEDQGYTYEDVTKINCGYDFLFSKGKAALHVEVKGTSSNIAGFFLTRNEHDAGYKADPAWRLAMVTRALSDKPEVQVFDAHGIKKAFDLAPYVYLGKPVARSEG